MSATHAVSQGPSVASVAAGENLDNQLVGEASGGAVFHQALMELLSANLANSDTLESLLSGVELPAGGEDLPPDALLAQLNAEAESEQGLSGLFELLSGAADEAEISAEQLLSELKSGLEELEEPAEEFARLEGQETSGRTDGFPLLDLTRPGQAKPIDELPELSRPARELAAAEQVVENTDQWSPVEQEQRSSQVVAETDLSAKPEQSPTLPSAFGEDEADGENEGVVLASAETETVKASAPELEVAAQTGGEQRSLADDATAEDDEAALVAEQIEKNQAEQALRDKAEEPVTIAAAPVADQAKPVQSGSAQVGDNRAAVIDAQSRAQAQLQTAAVDAESGADGDSPADADRQQSRAQQFRDGLASIKADALASGREGADASTRTQGLGSSFVLHGQSAAEPLARLNANASGFQQLQQMYGGDQTATVSLSAGARMGAEAWAPNIAQRISWMANQQMGRAEIRLDPPELGSLNIRLRIQHDQASISFSSPHAQVRDVLEQQMPRLREMLEEGGLQLQHSDVSDQSGSRQSASRGETSASESSAIASHVGEEESSAAMGVQQSLSMVDYYA